jgi:hypothetical protein
VGGQHTVVFTAFGVTLELAGPASMASDLDAILPPGWVPSDDVPAARFKLENAGRRYRASVNGDDLMWTERLDLALGILDSHIRGSIARVAPERIFVHAAVVVHDRGAIVLPGKSFAGKSTLTAALLAKGCRYMSDEYAVFDDAGQVHAYPRLLSLRRTGDSSDETAAGDLGATVREVPARTAFIGQLQYEAGGRWSVERQSPGTGALHLLHHAIPALDRPERTFAAVSGAAAGAVVISGVRGEADEAASAILALLAQ